MIMGKSTAIERFKASVDRLLGAVVATLMGVLVLDVLWQVFTRFVLQNPSSFTDELARYLLIWVGLLGAAYAMGQRLHLAIDLLPTRLSGRGRHVLGIIIEFAVLVFAVTVMVVGGARLVGLTLLLRQTSAALQLPLGVVYTVLPISGVLISIYALFFIGEHVQALRNGATTVPAPTAGNQDRAITTRCE